jgi:hypothetical protein
MIEEYVKLKPREPLIAEPRPAVPAAATAAVRTQG